MKKIFDPYNHGKWITGFQSSKFEDSEIVVLPGGADWSPDLYGHSKNPSTYISQRDDAEEMALMNKAIEAGKFLVGICRGSQGLTIRAGGWLIQDVSHPGRHNITTFDGRILPVNSLHHQMCYPYDLPSNEYRLLGWAEDLSYKHVIQGEKDLLDNLELSKSVFNEKGVFKEPEVIYYSQIRGLAIQSHVEYETYPSETRQWVNQQLNNLL